MTFWEVSNLNLEEFRPGIMSKAEFGKDLTMVCMEIGAHQEDRGHHHPFDQCGVVLAGRIEMSIGNERRILGSNGTYFIPAGIEHGWKTFENWVKILDITPKRD